MDRTLRAIATRFVECNPSAYATTRHATSVDTVHRLLYAVILLNTDLHSAGARDQRKMTRYE